MCFIWPALFVSRYQAFMEGWKEEDRRIRIEKRRRLIDLKKLFTGTECPACGHLKSRSLYLCPKCWNRIPSRTRRVLEKKDRFALARLFDLFDAVVRKAPLEGILVVEQRQEHEAESQKKLSFFSHAWLRP